MKRSGKPLLVLAVLAGAWRLAAETGPSAPDARADESIKLSPFIVSSSAATVGRYTSLESTSAGRVRLNLMDSSQSVSVLTSEMFEDAAAGRVLDAAKYIAGITESGLPTSWERINLRGFLGDGRTVDGFTFAAYPNNGFMNLDPAVIDRLEVVKGPSSILAPQPTSPGGTINVATKQPQFRNFGAINLQWGRFDANSGFIDVNRAVNDRLAVRVVASLRDWDNWWNGAYLRATTVMPAFTYRFSGSAQVTFQYFYVDWKSANYFGLPIDPGSSTTTPARVLSGIPRDLDIYGDDVYRADRQNDFKLLFTAELGRGLSMRLAAVYHTVSLHGPQINTGPSTGGFGGNYDPLTGLWNSGLRYDQAPPYASSPLPVPPTRTFVRSGIELFGEPRQWQVQNDYAYILENDSLKSTTLVGFAYSDFYNNDARAYNLSAPPFNIDHYVDTPFTRGSLNYSNHTSGSFRQAYVSEILALFQNRVILNAAGSWQAYDQRVQNMITGLVADSSPNTALPSYGIVVKPWHDAVSLYYSYTEQSSANVPSAAGVYVPPLSTARQHEFGARVKVWADKLYFTVAHFDIVQDNFGTPNTANLTTPPPNPLLPDLYSDRTAAGWEYELRASPTRNLSIIGGYTHFKNRDQNNVEFRTVAEKAGSLFASYTFDREHLPLLEGFRIGVGVDYLGRRPGDTPLAPTTVASTPTNVIPNQPSFYLDPRTLVNLTLAYDSKHHWSVQVNVDNLFNKEYILASVHRGAIFPGPPTNVRVSLRYDF